MGSALRFTWCVVGALALTVVYAVLQVGFVAPYLSPAQPITVVARPPAHAADDPAGWRAEYLSRSKLSRVPEWREHGTDWARRHLGTTAQVAVFTLAAILLLVLRSRDVTAGLAVLALALSGVAGGGPLFGVEHVVPLGFGSVLTVFAWIAGPVAFPIIALAILYFPARSPLLSKHPALHAVPFVVGLPMLVAGGSAGLYLAGMDAAAPIVAWNARNAGVFFGSFAGALAIDLAAIGEGLYRYRLNHDANERRRIRMAVYTAVPGVAACALKDALPIVAQLAGRTSLALPNSLTIALHALVLLSAFGLVYAVGVERVLGPRTFLRRSLQYALGSRTLTVLSALPLAALAAVLIAKHERTLEQVARESWLLFIVLMAASAAAFWYRNRARQWLDQRVFRKEYDARTILVSLASRVRFETHPGDLSTVVVDQIDAALHPRAIAILAGGVEEGMLTPVTELHRRAEPLPLDGGIASMLRWSNDPLELFLHDPRSAARRLPPAEREWLECTGARLLVPIIGQDRALIAVIALGEKQSEEAFTAEDRELLASIAEQMGPGFDIARLRRRAASSTRASSDTTRILAPTPHPMMECPRCGRCEEPGTSACPADGAAMQPVARVPRIVDGRYRIEQLLGRGGMGAVYRARDVRVDRLVALKVVRAELLGDPEARRRFLREAQIVARLQHPAIVSVYDFGTFADGGAYLIMELVRGEDLRRVLQREGRLEPRRALAILTTVCRAIEAAHREGVLHRDLKPENILLPGGDEEAKVLDFGVSKVLDDRQAPPAEAATILTSAGLIVGTPAYMAPEQLRGDALDGRTDVFSLGVIAFEMLTGELPFGRGSLAEVVLAHARGVPPMPGAAPALARAVRAALEPEADRRPPSPQAFAHLLSAAAAI